MKKWLFERDSAAPYVLIFFGLLALIAASSLLSSSRIAGDSYESGLSLWVTWFPQHAFRENIDLVYNNYALYPIKTNLLPLISLPTSFLYEILRIPFDALLAFNLLFPLYLTLTAYVSYRFFLREAHNPVLAVLGGGMLAFNPITLALAQSGEVALLAIFVLPLWMLVWARFVENPTPARLLQTVLALYLVVLISAQFWNLILTLLLPYAVFQVHRAGETRKILLDYVLYGVLLLGVLLLIYPASPLLWSTYGGQYKPIWQDGAGLHAVAQVFAWGGLVVMLLSLAAPWEFSPDRRWWGFIAGVNILLYFLSELAPLTQIGEIFRVPHNPQLVRPVMFLFPVMLAGAVLVFQAVAGWHKQLNLPIGQSYVQGYVLYAGLAAILIGISGWWQGVPTTIVPRYDFYASLADEPENYLLVDFPIGVMTRQQFSDEGYWGITEYTGLAMINAVQHKKRIIGGVTDHITEEELSPYQDSAFVRLISFQPDPEDLSIETKVQTIKTEIQRWRVGYVVLRPEAVPPEFVIALRGWLTWMGSFCYIGQEDDIEFWRSTWHPAGCPPYTIQVGGAEGEHAMLDGWYAPEFWGDSVVRWAGPEPESHVMLWADRPQSDYRLTIRAASEIPDQVVEVFANGSRLGEITLSSEWEDHIVTIPRRLIQDGGLLNMTLTHKSSRSIEGRTLTAVYQSFMLEVAAP